MDTERARTYLRAVMAAALVLVVAGCGDDDTTPGDMGRADMGDGGLLDGARPRDMGGDMLPVDLGIRDASFDGAMSSPESEAILAVREAAVGDVDLAIDGVFVTAVIPAVGSDPAGFFVQHQAMGPALFVAVDPTSLATTPSVGDTVSFNVDETALFFGQHRVVAISGFSVDDTGADVSMLVEDLSDTTDVAANVEDYESELVTVTGTLERDPTFSGTGFEQWKLMTDGSDDALFVLRATTALDREEAFGVGCTVTVGPTPLWRYRGEAMAMAWESGDLTAIDCPAPTLREVQGADQDTVLVRFSRPIEASTLTTGDISITPSLTVTAVTIDDTIAVVTTGVQTVGESYDLVVDGVTDTAGEALDDTEDSGSFAGFGDTVEPGVGDLVITEIFPDGGAVLSDDLGPEWFEVFNPQSDGGITYQLRGCTLEVRDGVNDPQPVEWTVVIRPNEFVVFGGRPLGEPPGVIRLRPELPDDGAPLAIGCGGVTVDEVDYGAADFPLPTEKSLQLTASVDSTVTNDLALAWCVTPDDRTYGTRDFVGTPAMVNVPCSGGTPVFTQYVEGDAGVQAIELANVGSAPQSLVGCEVRYYEGTSTAPTATFELPPETTLLPDETFTLCNTGVTTTCDMVDPELAFDGDDALTLVCDENVFDRFGQLGGGTVTTDGTLSTMDQTLTRACSVTSGETDPTAAFDLTDWEGSGAGSANDETGLGTYDCP